MVSFDIESAWRYGYAVLWAIAGRDNYGAAIVSAPVQLRVRWEERTGQTIDSEGNVLKTDATVVVDRDIENGSIMRLGKLTDVPVTPDNLKEVVDFHKTPDIDGRYFRRVAILRKYNNTHLPNIAE